MNKLTGLGASAFLVLGLLAGAGTAQAQDVINLKFHSSFGKSPLNEAPRWWMDEVEKRTNGKVKFTHSFAGILKASADKVEVVDGWVTNVTSKFIGEYTIWSNGEIGTAIFNERTSDGSGYIVTISADGKVRCFRIPDF